MKWVNKLPLIIAILLLGYGFLNAKNPNLQSNLNNNYISSLPWCDIYKIWDGDTSRASCNGQEIKVRYACFDSRETKQDGGLDDRDFLRSLINSANNKAKVDVIKKDRYGRSVSELWIDRGKGWESVAVIMVANGHGWAYHQYKADCQVWNQVESAEQAAIRNRLGIWASNNPTAPWDWRKNQR